MIALTMMLMVLLPALALGQPDYTVDGDMTIAVSADSAGIMVPTFNSTPGVPFDIVVWMDNELFEDGNAAEFVVTDVRVLYPSVFKLGTIKINNTTLDLGDNNVGEYLLSFGGCLTGGPLLELVRVTFGDFGGAIPPFANDNLTLRGFQFGDSRPSSFGGEPGVVSCDSQKHVLEIGGMRFGSTQDVPFAAGTMVLNPGEPVVDNDTASFGALKSRF
ncbi:hypothetical protein DRQ53_13195 [bacterium]|nr:MAG: hypothetical protein DRQ53_13195 [bacterium]